MAKKKVFKKVPFGEIDGLLKTAVNCLGSVDKVLQAVGYSGKTAYDGWYRDGYVPEQFKWALMGLTGKHSGTGFEQAEIVTLIQLSAEANQRDLVVKLARMM